MLYFDHNATTPLLPEVADFMAEVARRGPLNPSSAHRAGASAREVISAARENVAALLNCESEAVAFTSGGTEANSAVLQHAAQDGAIITTAIEHSSVLATCEQLERAGCRIRYADVSIDGEVSADQIDHLLSEERRRGPVSLVSVQWANNETGVLQPIEQVVEICRAHEVALHVDAAQVVGKVSVDLNQIEIDYLTFTGHKLHGPTGIGALVANRAIRPWLFGGDQENRLRAGTENVLGIAGLGRAAELRRERFPTVSRELFRLRNEFESGLMTRFPWTRVNGQTAKRVPNTSSVRFCGLDGQAMMAQLDVAGICVSQSSACTNHRPEPSYVLRAMGLSEADSYSTLRFSFGETNSEKEVQILLENLSDIVGRLSALERRA